MPFFKKREDPEVSAARATAEAALPPGWVIANVDLERYRLPGSTVDTYGVTASGPSGEGLLVIAVGEANAHHQLVRGLRGDLEVTEAWAPELSELADPLTEQRRVHLYADQDPGVASAFEDARAAMPPQWFIFENDRERYRVPGGRVEVYGISAASTTGEVALVLGVGEANAFRALGQFFRGELPTAEAWAPPLTDLVR